MVDTFLDGLTEQNDLTDEAVRELADQFNDVDVTLREAVYQKFLEGLEPYGFHEYFLLVREDA